MGANTQDQDYAHKIHAVSDEARKADRNEHHHVVYFNEGYTRQLHFAFLAARWGLSSPRDDQQIASRIGFYKESKGLYWVAGDIRHLFDIILPDPGVQKVVEARYEDACKLLAKHRHPIRHPFMHGSEEAQSTWLVEFVADKEEYTDDTRKQHFEKIGFVPDIANKYKDPSWNLGDYVANLTEEDIYKILSDSDIFWVTQCTMGKFN